MNFDAFGNNVPDVLAHLPQYGVLLVAAPLLFIVLMKLLLSLRSAASKKARAQWIVSGEYDENGMPQLARAHAASDAARYRAAMAAWKPRNGR